MQSRIAQSQTPAAGRRIPQLRLVTARSTTPRSTARTGNFFLPTPVARPEPLPDAAPSTETTRRALAHERIKGLARRTFSRQVLSEIGPPAGLFALDAGRFPDPVLVSTSTSAGPKLKLAAQLGLQGSVGADLVNHCVNDIAIQGAIPLFFQDCLAAGHLCPDIVSQIISGLVDACKANGCALLGGETSELPRVYAGRDFELSGFLTGVVSRPQLLTGDAIREGDCLLALPSNGLHSSGYAMAQQLLLEIAGYRPEQYINDLGDKVGAALMRPHRSYLAPIRKLIQAEVVSGFAHITAGGLTESLPRLFPRGLAPQVDISTWEPPPLFKHLRCLGDIDLDAMHATFNMGIGLVAMVSPDQLQKARSVLTRMNERSFVIGRVVRKASQRTQSL